MRPNFSDLKYNGGAACSKVENSEWLTPEKIVVKTNFANQSSLGRFFRKHTGMSPSEYRKSMMETYY